MYADDVQLHLSRPMQSIIMNVNRLNDDLDRIHHWAKGNDLRLNPHKSRCMVIRRRTLDFNIGFYILMNGEKIKIVDGARNLVLTFKLNVLFNNIVRYFYGLSCVPFFLEFL